MLKRLFGAAAVKKEAEAYPIYNELHRTRLPRHTAIRMDGNGRRAQRQGLLRTAGHKAGVDTLKRVLKTAIALDLEVLTVYAFSTENWKRPHTEVDFIMKLFFFFFDKEVRERIDLSLKQYNVDYDKVAYYFPLDEKTSISRVNQRNRDPNERFLPLDVPSKYINKIVPPSVEEEFKDIIINRNSYEKCS